jgi:small conductance mechanosensitive channel
MKEDKRILTTPSEPFVAVSELGDSSVNFAVRAWVKSSDYWDVFFSMNEKIYNTFEKEHLEIPYPTMNVNLSKLN